MKIKVKTGLAKVAQGSGKGSVAGESNGSSESTMSWLTKGSENIKAKFESAKFSQRRYAPEVMFREDEEVTLRFRSDEPIGCFQRYSYRMNGRWNRVTAPAPGARDLLREAGLKSSLCALYEVIDVNGYTDKEGKEHRMLARFLPANQKMYEQLEVIRRKKGTLKTFNICITRSGSKQKTTYTILPDAPEPLKGAEKVPTIRAQVNEFYSPPSIEQQKSIVNNFEPDTD